MKQTSQGRLVLILGALAIIATLIVGFVNKAYAATIITSLLSALILWLYVYDVDCTVHGKRENNWCNGWAWIKAILLAISLGLVFLIQLGMLAGGGLFHKHTPQPLQVPQYY